MRVDWTGTARRMQVSRPMWLYKWYKGGKHTSWYYDRNRRDMLLDNCKCRWPLDRCAKCYGGSIYGASGTMYWNYPQR